MKSNSQTRLLWIFLLAIVVCISFTSCDETDDFQIPDKDNAPEALLKELVQNPGFEEPNFPIPKGWNQDMAKTGNKGTISQDQTRAHSGSASLKLQPNRHNDEKYPLAVAQMLPARAYRGRKVEISGHFISEGDATGAFGILSIVKGRPLNLKVVTHPSRSKGWVHYSQVYDVPDDSSVQLVFTCFVGGNSGAAWIDDVSVMPYVKPPSKERVKSLPDTLKASVEIDAATVIRQIPRTLYGTNVEWIWNANMMWQEKQKKPHPEIVRLTQDLGVTLIRYPGGHFADFYHWKDGIGPYKKRPEVQHEPGKKDRTRINFGTDEALDFAKKVNAELLITVNAGTGNALQAAQWVRYLKGKPQHVNFWEVGNELYIKDNSHISKATTVDPTRYAQLYRKFAQAMRAVDPSIKIGAIGGANQGRYSIVNYPDWNRIVLQQAGDHIDFLAIHNAYAPLVGHDQHKDLRVVYQAMLAAPQLIARNLKNVSKQIEKYAPDRAAQIGIAVTEWGPAFMFEPNNRYVDHVKTLGSALYAASVLKVFIESPRTQIANFFLLNDMSVLGWIGSRNGKFPPNPDWAATARYYAFQLYTQHFGDQLVSSRTTSPTYDSQAIGLIDAVRDVPYIDIVSSLSTDGRTLYIMAVNKHFNSAIETSIALRGFNPKIRGNAWTLTGTAIDAHTGTTPLQIPGFGWARQATDKHNSRFDKGGTDEIKLSSSSVENVGLQFTYRFPPHSVTSLILTLNAGDK